MGLWARLFGRKPALIDMRHLGEEFRVGDLAQCIAARWPDSEPENPRAGDILRVTGIYEGIDTTGCILGIGLTFEGKPQTVWWCRHAFRKIVIAHEPAEAEFTALIKRPVRKRERA